ncbi:hypothetical protein bsdtb5_29400 [Anaeromicropila herbilytica]|uniref:Uncharacterized protein n=1 Tax=Anaeromicropila herbilytica TaxID=2785025 RepID=A0A7R7EMF1_9FIRM|nr:hypothetical protein bsdtb5_29400 [Anaeromicropila herbilytica]
MTINTNVVWYVDLMDPRILSGNFKRLYIVIRKGKENNNFVFFALTLYHKNNGRSMNYEADFHGILPVSDPYAF